MFKTILSHGLIFKACLFFEEGLVVRCWTVIKKINSCYLFSVSTICHICFLKKRKSFCGLLHCSNFFGHSCHPFNVLLSHLYHTCYKIKEIMLYFISIYRLAEDWSSEEERKVITGRVSCHSKQERWISPAFRLSRKSVSVMMGRIK